MDILSLGTVSETLVVAGQAEDVVDIKGSRPQDITLKGDSVPVPGDHLQDRFQPHEFQSDAGGQATQTGHGGLVVGYIDGINMVFNHFSLADDPFAGRCRGGGRIRK